MSWFSRMITLRKSQNSLSDVLGKDVATMLQATLLHLIANTVYSAVNNAVEAGNNEVFRLRTTVTTAIMMALTNASPTVVGILNAAITKATIDFTTVTKNEVADVTTKIVTEIGKVLKLT